MASTLESPLPSSKPRRSPRLAALAVASFLVGLGAAEVLLRVYVAIREEPRDLRNYMTLLSGEDTGLYQPDAERLYSHVPGVHRGGRVRINEDGFRDSISPSTPKRNDEIRVLLVGGSTTFGIGLPDDEIWAARLKRLLTEAMKPMSVEVINAGVGGYTTAESLKALETRGLAYLPDIVVIGHVYNDVNARTVKDDFRSDYSHYRPARWRPDDRPSWLAWSFLYNLYRVKLTDARFQGSIYYMTVRDFDGDVYYGRGDMAERLRRLDETDTSVFSENLTRIVELSRSVNALPVLLTGPLSPSAWPSMERGVSEGNDAIRALARERETALIDLAATFPADDPSLFRSETDPMHMSAAGARVRAELVASGLVPLLRRRYHEIAPVQ